MDVAIPRWQRRTTGVIVVLSAAFALVGLLGNEIYPETLLPQFYVQDALVLLLGAPLLGGALLFALRGSIRARIAWLGALAFMAYLYASIGLQVPFNRLYLGYVLVFSLSLFTFVAGTVQTDATAVRQSATDGLSERLYGWGLILIAVGLAAMWLAELVPATISGVPPLLVSETGPQALVSHFIDLAVVVPGLIVGGRWLRRERPWGYVLGGIGLVFGGVLAPSIIGATIVILLEGDITVPFVAAVLSIVPMVIVAGLAIKYLSELER